MNVYILSLYFYYLTLSVPEPVTCRFLLSFLVTSSRFCYNGPGLSPEEPMAIFQAEVQAEVKSIPDGRYIIKNRAADICWYAVSDDKVHYSKITLEHAKQRERFQVEFSNYSSVQRIILFQSMTSQTTLMVTSL